MKRFCMIVVLMGLMFNQCIFPVRDVLAEEISQSDKLDTLLKLIQFKEGVESLPEDFLDSFRNGFNISEFGKLEEIAFDAFDPDVMYKKVKNDLNDNYNEAFVDFLINELATEKQMAITERERYAGTGKGEAEFKKFSQEFLINQYASPERLALAKEMLEVSGAVDVQVELAVSTMSIFAEILKETDPEKAFQMGDFAEHANDLKEQLKPKIVQGLLLRTLFIYKDMSDEEFKGYLEFSKGQEVRWFNEIVNNSTLSQMKEDMESFYTKAIPILNEAGQNQNGQKSN